MAIIDEQINLSVCNLTEIYVAIWKHGILMNRSIKCSIASALLKYSHLNINDESDRGSTGCITINSH
ncbi:hypothetical protein BLOT_016668 [Blomia tropicalis]|nr:hypothetical protein BLOT_016668 [Blomia tropicalis]